MRSVRAFAREYRDLARNASVLTFINKINHLTATPGKAQLRGMASLNTPGEKWRRFKSTRRVGVSTSRAGRRRYTIFMWREASRSLRLGQFRRRDGSVYQEGLRLQSLVSRSVARARAMTTRHAL